MARHAMVDLSQIFSLEPVRNVSPTGSPEARYNSCTICSARAASAYAAMDIRMSGSTNMRALYEGYARGAG